MKALCSLFFVVLCSLAGQARAVDTFLVVTVLPESIQTNIKIKDCASIVTIPPDAATYTLYADYTFIEEVTVNSNTVQYTGYWSALDDTVTKFRLTYTGNPADRTGSWGEYIVGMENIANSACGGNVEVLGASLRVKKFDLVIKPLTGCGGSTKLQFQSEVYGYNSAYSAYGKGQQKTSHTGTFIIGPGYSGPMFCI